MLVLQKLSRGVSLQYLKRFSSSAVTAAIKSKADPPEDPSPKKISNNSLVAAAFASLKEETGKESSSQASGKKSHKTIDERIISANSVSSLLAITEGNGQLTRKQALKVVSILAEWSSINRAKLSDFENDARFLRLCKLLGRTVPKSEQVNNHRKSKSFKTDDLSTVLGIAGDDEAAKLIASISLPQMVKVMTTLAQKKRRSTPLLRSLAFNISSNSEQLDLKQSADVLYSMASLNFPDSVLTAKVCADVQSALPSNEDKTAVVGSILTSIGLLKYRDIDLLESLGKWVLGHYDECRPQDISALFLTLATLNYKLQDLDELKGKVANSLCAEDFPKRLDWLNHVWALTLLKSVDSKQISSVLSQEFLEQLMSERMKLTPNAKLKLLNINAYARSIGDKYKGNMLPADSDVFSVPLAHTKSKQILLNGMLDALKSLMTSSTYVKSLVDSKMGFLIDAQCMFDSKRNPLPVEQEHKDAIKVAIMIVDFHDTCHGPHRAICGYTDFSFEMLESRGFKVVAVPYNEFNTSDKLLKRVQYLEKRFKTIVSEKN